LNGLSFKISCHLIGYITSDPWLSATLVVDLWTYEFRDLQRETAAAAMGEEKKEENGADEKKGDEKQSETEPKPEPVTVLKVDMHCTGCAREVMKSIKHFKGVEHFEVDMHLNKVTVKGNVDPLKLRERVQKKSGRKTELISPLVLPNKTEEKEQNKTEEKKDKPEPVVVTVVLNVNMHCEGCAQTVKKNILKMKGVQTVDPDFKSQKVTVKGTVDPKRLSEHVYRRTGKRVQIQSTAIEGKAQDSDGKTEVGSENKDEAKPAEGEKKEEKKEEGGEDKKEEAKPDGDGGEKKDGGEKNEGEVKKDGEDKKDTEPPAVVKEGAGNLDGTETVMFEGKKFEVPYPRYVIEHVYPPQLFSDENPNACSIM